MFQNGLQIHFQTLRRRCDRFIPKLQFYIVIIVSITIYKQLQLRVQHEGQVPGEPGDQVTGGDHGDDVVQAREAPPLPPASQWARARSCGPPGREREYYAEHCSSGMQVSTLCWLYICGQPFCPKLSAKNGICI